MTCDVVIHLAPSYVTVLADLRWLVGRLGLCAVRAIVPFAGMFNHHPAAKVRSLGCIGFIPCELIQSFHGV